MNETLKFSWGHILAFLALIAVSYVSFIGYTYLSDGNFFFAIAGAVLTDIVYGLIFFGAQTMKSSGNKIGKKIVWERILIFASPFIFAGCMVGIAHFWTVRSQDGEIVNSFKSSINNSRQMFSDYENYAHGRIAAYDAVLSTVIANKNMSRKVFEEAGFKEGQESIQKANMLEVLRLQLLPDNYTRLKESANKWIDDAGNGASTWNVFIIGNTRQIKEALQSWEKELKEYAAPRMMNEEILEGVPDFESTGAMKAGAGLDNMSQTFSQWKYPVWEVFFFGAIIYFLLLFPYFLQPRHGRQVAAGYSLFKTRKDSGLMPPPVLTSPIAPQKIEIPKDNIAKEEKKKIKVTEDKTPEPNENNSGSEESENSFAEKMKQLKSRTL